MKVKPSWLRYLMASSLVRNVFNVATRSEAVSITPSFFAASPALSMGKRRNKANHILVIAPIFASALRRHAGQL